MVLNIFWTDLEPDGDSFQLPVVEFPPRIIVISEINVNSDFSLLKALI